MNIFWILELIKFPRLGEKAVDFRFVKAFKHSTVYLRNLLIWFGWPWNNLLPPPPPVWNSGAVITDSKGGSVAVPRVCTHSVPCRVQFKGRAEKSTVTSDSDYLREPFAPHMPWLLQLMDTVFEPRAPFGGREKKSPPGKSHLPAWQMPTRIFLLFRDSESFSKPSSLQRCAELRSCRFHLSKDVRRF